MNIDCYWIQSKEQLNLGSRDILVEKKNPNITELSRLKCALENIYSYRFLINPIDFYLVPSKFVQEKHLQTSDISFSVMQ